MKVTGVILLLTLTVVSGELLQVLHLLHTSDAFHYLTPDEKVLLTEVVAAAEACKLYAFLQTTGRDPVTSQTTGRDPVTSQTTGRDPVTSLIAHLPGELESNAHDYITDHLRKESEGTCVVDATPAPTHHN